MLLQWCNAQCLDAIIMKLFLFLLFVFFPPLLLEVEAAVVSIAYFVIKEEMYKRGRRPDQLITGQNIIAEGEK